ncbi:MAG: hypothetical protein LBH59_00965 [Planctomycetaceae bacterium]|jgi:hypothetical protein|nr:hypothetical protein [Planctomycetaceae bacterium]
MKFLDRYFINRIDNALDQAVPLDAWTAWYVKRNPKLQEYYIAMLELEIELRYSDAELENNKNPQNNNQICCPNCSCPNKNQQHNNYWQSSKKIFWINAVVISFIIPAALLLIYYINLQYNSNTSPDLPTPIITQTVERKINLGEIFSDAIVSAMAQSDLVLPQNTIEDSVLEFLVDPIVNFTDNPTEATLTFLTTTAIAKPQNQNKKISH